MPAGKQATLDACRPSNIWKEALDCGERTLKSRLATSRPLGERNVPCLAAKQPTFLKVYLKSKIGDC